MRHGASRRQCSEPICRISKSCSCSWVCSRSSRCVHPDRSMRGLREEARPCDRRGRSFVGRRLRRGLQLSAGRLYLRSPSALELGRLVGTARSFPRCGAALQHQFGQTPASGRATSRAGRRHVTDNPFQRVGEATTRVQRAVAAIRSHNNRALMERTCSQKARVQVWQLKTPMLRASHPRTDVERQHFQW
jgi:hypothetical protein